MNKLPENSVATPQLPKPGATASPVPREAYQDRRITQLEHRVDVLIAFLSGQQKPDA